MVDKYLHTQSTDPCLGTSSQIIPTFYHIIYLILTKVDICQSFVVLINPLFHNVEKWPNMFTPQDF